MAAEFDLSTGLKSVKTADNCKAFYQKGVTPALLKQFVLTFERVATPSDTELQIWQVVRNMCTIPDFQSDCASCIPNFLSAYQTLLSDAVNSTSTVRVLRLVGAQLLR